MKMIEYIEKDTARRIINSPRTKEQMLSMLEGSFTMALPKHHGRLIDADKVESMLKNHAKSESEAWALVELLNVLDEVPIVLEATKEGEK